MVMRRKHKATSTPQFTEQLRRAMIEAAEAHNKEGECAAALREYEAYITNAWKNRSPEIDIVGVRPSDPDWPFLQAWLAWVNRADIVPLVTFINSDHPLSRLMRSAIAGLIGILYARSQPRKEGKPGGIHTRWQDPRYLVAWLTEQHMNAWKKKEGRRNIPNTEQENIIQKYINEGNG